MVEILCYNVITTMIYIVVVEKVDTDNPITQTKGAGLRYPKKQSLHVRCKSLPTIFPIWKAL